MLTIRIACRSIFITHCDAASLLIIGNHIATELSKLYTTDEVGDNKL